MGAAPVGSWRAAASSMLIYKLRFGKKAIRFDKHGRRGHQHLHGHDEHHRGRRNEVTTID